MLDAAGWRAEIARAVPFYAGIEGLARQGDQLQYGGRHLCAGGEFPRPGGRAAFAPVGLLPAAAAQGRFGLTTRRGKQFNSIVHADVDPLTGAGRRDVLVAEEDARGLGILDGDAIVVTSAHGSLVGRARYAPIQRGNVQAFWPEVNALLPFPPHDALSGVPEYGTRVDLAKAPTERP